MNNCIKEKSSSSIYDKFPSANYLIAVFDKVVDYYIDEFKEVANERQLDSIDNWYLAGVAEDSPGSYYVMDMIKVFYNMKTGEIIKFNDHDIYSGGNAYTAFRAQDAIKILDYNENENLEDLIMLHDF